MTLFPSFNDIKADVARIFAAFVIAVVGLLIAALIVVALLIAGVRDGKDIAAVVGLFTGVLGTIVGAFFGLQVGSAGKEEADRRAARAEDRAAITQTTLKSLLVATDATTLARANDIHESYPQMLS